MDEKNLHPVTTSKVSPAREEALLFGIKDTDKIESFESMLSELLRFSDSIPEAIAKMVKAALACEFGSKVLEHKKCDSMVKAISQGIMSDTELRRQALLIMDRLAKADELNA